MRDIRRAKAEDAIAISRLYSELNSLSMPSVLPDQIKIMADSSHAYLLVCEEDKEIVASALLCICSDAMFNHQPFALVENLIVSRDYRREGFGKHLMKYIESLCDELNCSKIMLLASNGNKDAREFYTSIGYDPHAKVGLIKYRRDFNS